VDEKWDALFPPDGPARYEYWLKCELPAGAKLRRLTIGNDLQMAPLAMPGMAVGENRFVYTDASPERRVRITHEWVERSLSRPPAAPAAAVSPADGADSDGTDIAFEWSPAKDPDEDAIADYHFELSDREDLAWPLSSVFEKLISRTSERGTSCYRLHEAGLLTPGRRYYWHVRAKDAKASGAPGAGPGASPRVAWAIPSRSRSTPARSAGRPTPAAASPPATACTEATRRASASATDPTRSRSAPPRTCRRRSTPTSSPRRPRPLSRCSALT
jgi:hypothetical protein